MKARGRALTSFSLSMLCPRESIRSSRASATRSTSRLKENMFLCGIFFDSTDEDERVSALGGGAARGSADGAIDTDTGRSNASTMADVRLARRSLSCAVSSIDFCGNIRAVFAMGICLRKSQQ